MLSHRTLAAAAVGFVAFLSAPLFAQDTVNIRTEPVPEIEVRGDRPLDDATVSDGIRDIAVSRAPREPRAQFADPLCLHVQGLGAVLDQRVGDRVRSHAETAGLKIAKAGCTPNAMLLVVDEPGALIERLRSMMPQLFTPQLSRRLMLDAERGEPAINWVLEGPRWRLANGVSTGEAIVPGGFLFDNDVGGFPTANEAWASRVRNSFGLARIGAFIVFDVRQLEDVHLDQLADYATMQLLTSPRRQIDFESLAAPSILTLFNDGPWDAPQGLTRLDRAYLNGLYAMRPNDWGSRLLTSARRVNAEAAETEVLP